MTRRALPYHLIIHGISIAAIISLSKALIDTSRQRDLYYEGLRYEWQKTAPEIPKFVEGKLILSQEMFGCNPERR